MERKRRRESDTILRKRVLTFTLLFLMLGVAFSLFQIRNVKAGLDDWASADHSTRRLITYDSDNATIAPDANASNVIIYLALGDSNCSDITDSTDDENDLRFYGTDSTGAVVELDYDVISDDMVDGSSSTYWKGYVELVHVPSARNTTFYVYYDESDTSESNYEDATGTYANGVAVYHFEESDGNVTDVFGDTGTVNGTMGYSGTGKITKGLTFSGDDYIDSVSIALGTSHTILSWATLSGTNDIMASSSGSYINYVFSSVKTADTLTYRPPSSASYAYCTHDMTVSNFNMYVTTRSGTTVAFYPNAVSKSVSGSISNNSFTVDRISGRSDGYNWHGVIDELLFFGEVKTLNFIKHYYYTTSAPASYISFGDAEVSNTAPNKPTITTIGGEANASIIYDQDLTAGFKIVLNGTNSSDPDGDAQKWAWIVDDNADFGSIDYNSGYVTPIDYDWTTALTKNKVWYFRVDAIDPSGSGTYNSSGMYKYTLNNKAPTAGTLSSPTDASTTYDTTPIFEWGAGSDDDGDTLTMQVKVYDASGNLDYNNTLGALTTATPAGALDLGVYTWRVRYYDGYAYTNSSDFTFTLIANTPPNKPTITLIGGSDTNGSTIYDIDATSNFLIYLKGYNSSDPDGDDQSFGWLIDDDGAFGSIAYDTRWFAGHGDINASMTTTLPKKTWYYFRLDAKDPLGSDTVNSSVIRKHYIGNYVPTMPVVTAPTTTTSDTTPAITWTNSSDTDGDALTYRVEISNASGVVRQSAWGVSQPYVNATALDFGNYNITIYVYDTYDTNTSVVESFEVIAVAPPTMPTLTYPEAWAIRVLGTTHMNWTDSTDTEGDAFTYTLYIESQAMTGQYIIKDGLTTSDYNAGDLDLLECHTYRWKVKSVQTDDNSTLGYTDWSYFQVDCMDIYEIKIQSAFNSGTDKVDVIMWLEKNGQIMTDVSVPSLVMKDYANTTVTTLNAGTIYSDGIYRDTYTITGTEAGLYTLKGTLTYNGIVYYGVGVFDANTKEIRDLIEALVVGSGADQYEVRTSASYDETSGTVEVISWIQKNGVQMTGISSVTVVMKDEANTTLHNFNDGTVYTDGFYRATWTATGLHGLYSLRTTLTYSGNTYTGGSHFDAGIMELFDALDTMTSTINTIEANVSSALTYIGDPTDTASDSTLFGYGQFIKDKWGTYTAEQIYNKVVDVYNVAVDANSTSADVLTALSDLDTYVTTYMGVDIRTSASYSFVNDELQIAVAYVQDGAIKDTTSCTLVLKDSDGTTLKTFTDAEDADHIYRYEWNTSAVDFPANGLTGLYTLIPSVVYNGGTFTTVSHFSAEMPDVYGTTTYTAVVTPYRDSGYSVSVVGDSITEGQYLYVKGVDATMPDIASATVYIYWEDVSNTVLSTTTTTGTVDTGVLRVQAMTPSSVTETDHVRLVATKTDYGHHTVTMSGVSSSFSVLQKAVGSGLGSPVSSLEIRSTPVLQSGKKVDIAVLADASRPATCDMVLRLSKGSVVISEEKYTATLVSGSNPLMLSFPVPNADTGSYSMALTDGFRVRDTETFELVGGKSFWSVFEFEWKVPGTNIIISTK